MESKFKRGWIEGVKRAGDHPKLKKSLKTQGDSQKLVLVGQFKEPVKCMHGNVNAQVIKAW